jgi:tRNA-dihydrouridine synthase 3
LIIGLTISKYFSERQIILQNFSYYKRLNTMIEQPEAQMAGVSPGHEHAELVADASNIATSNYDGERASKRVKTNGSIPSESVPGEGLHDAPAPRENRNVTNGDKEDAPQESNSDSKQEYVDGRTKGIAPIKKE